MAEPLSALEAIDCEETCGPAVDCGPNASVFEPLRVRPTIKHGAWIEWRLRPGFTGIAPYTFQLQVGRTGANSSSDWANVGSPAAGVAFLLDDAQRVFGQTQYTHYRVKLTTADNHVYYSAPQHTWGDLSRKFWPIYRSRLKTLLLDIEKQHHGQQGYLLKRMTTGPRPAADSGARDFLTGEVINPDDEETVGTEYVGGYFAPIPCVFASLDPLARHEKLDPSLERGSVNDLPVVKAKMLALPQLDSGDVWVNKRNDFRWQIGEIKHLEEIQGVPLVCSVELTLLQFSHVVYGLVMPDQLPSP